MEEIKNISIEENDFTNLRAFRIPKGKPKDAVWKEIIEKIEIDYPTNHRLSVWKPLLSVAAFFIGITILGSLSWVLIFGKVEHFTPKGNHMTILLPDSSKVYINADSHIQYNKYLWSYSRSVTLEGEAMFEVKRGESFSVKSGDVVTQVLGTTFNVYSRNSNVRVSCIEGRVSVVHSKTKQTVLLKQSQGTELVKTNLKEPEAVSISEITSWVSGEFNFINERLEVVFQEIERQFNVKVIYDAIEERYYTGVFFNQNLSESLDLICIPMQLTWRENKGVIYISNTKSIN